jgi:serine/threonine protein kinase
MQSVRSAQQWSFDGDVPVFLCTTIVYDDGGDYYICQSKERQPKLDAESINTLAPKRIIREQIWPLLEESLTICDEATRPDIYIKQPRLTAYDNNPALAHLLLQEARVCEILMRNPHPNVARYLGCYVQEGRIAGLCFQRYAETAEERKRSGRPINKALVLDQISAAITHLHSIRLEHNDVKASNIMFHTESSDNAILNDFDSCAVIGGPLPAKRGSIDAVGLEELARSL